MPRMSWRAAASLGVALLAGTTAYLIYLDATASLPVVVATRPLQAPLKVEADMVSVVPLPAAAVHPRAVGDPSRVIGHVLRRDVEAGEPLLEADVVAGEGAGLSDFLEEHQQAFFIPTRLEQGLGGAVEPGDRVDVIFVGGEGPGAVARTLLENLPVLQVRDEEGRRYEDGRPLGVLVGVTPAEAERLAYALTYGRVYLALAPAGGAVGGGSGVTWDNLFLFPDDLKDAGPAATPATGPAAGSPPAPPARPVQPTPGAVPPPGAGPAESPPLESGEDSAEASGPEPAIPLVDPQWMEEGADGP
ncbi:Flp pilus assembly protein CpaB [Thermaerobacter sp. PB12/4term]|nr:Flp pilus assembly protein CpaB [Thermaerobacter sp. PB12/4term]